MKHGIRLLLVLGIAVMVSGSPLCFAEAAEKPVVIKKEKTVPSAQQPAAAQDRPYRPVKAGMTQAQVLDLVGPPEVKKPRKKGGEIWIYRKKNEKVGPSKPDLPYPTPEKSVHEKTLRVFFNTSGIADDVKLLVSSEEAHSKLLPGESVKKDEAKAENKAELGS